VTREKKWISRLRVAALPVVVVASLLVAWRLGYFDLERRQHLVGVVEHIRLWPWAETAYVIAYAIAITLCLPAAVATILGGAVFGAWKGALFAWIGSMVGTVLAHVLARTIARGPVKRLFGEHRYLRELKNRDTVLALFRLRLLPVAPFAVLDYVAGVAGVSLRRLMLATMIGIVPSVVAYTYVGAELLKGIISQGEASHRALWIAGGVSIAMFVLSIVPTVMQKLRG
jgi:uncharacterized membrane protein YdjX (TVP38/TMEM64 family)